jgi:hypothetical protein
VSEGLRILAPRTPVLATALVTANQTVAAAGVFGPWHMKRRLYTPLVTPGATLTLKGRVQVVSGATSALNMGTDTLPAAGSGAAPPGFITAYTE